MDELSGPGFVLVYEKCIKLDEEGTLWCAQALALACRRNRSWRPPQALCHCLTHGYKQ